MRFRGLEFTPQCVAIFHVPSRLNALPAPSRFVNRIEGPLFNLEGLWYMGIFLDSINPVRARDVTPRRVAAA
jgi:hypothetical protein